MAEKILQEKIKFIEAQMQSKLEEIRTTFSQGGDKGQHVEKVIREFLRYYLPCRLEVGSGEIIDSRGNRSNQTDIVVVTEDHPLTFEVDSAGLFFVEGVCAAGEIKAILTSTELKDSLNKSFAFKKLEIAEGIGTPLSINPSDKSRYYRHPPFFLLAFESQLKLSTIEETIKEFLKANDHKENDVNVVLDGVFVLNQGWIINFGDGQGCFQFVNAEGKVSQGWTAIENKTVLFDLIAWLSCVMPRISLNEPILPRYMVRRKTN